MCVIRKLFRQNLKAGIAYRTMSLSEKDISRIVVRIVDYGMNTQHVANQFDVSRRRVQQLAKEYREKEIPKLSKRGRPSRTDYPMDLEDRVKRAKKKVACWCRWYRSLPS